MEARLLALSAILLLSNAGVHGQLPAGFVFTSLGDGQTGDNVVDIRFVRSGLALIVGRTGLINIALLTGDEPQIALYLDLRNLTATDGARRELCASMGVLFWRTRPAVLLTCPRYRYCPAPTLWTRLQGLFSSKSSLERAVRRDWRVWR
jgi:hypothetical protein